MDSIIQYEAGRTLDQSQSGFPIMVYNRIKCSTIAPYHPFAIKDVTSFQYLLIVFESFTLLREHCQNFEQIEIYITEVWLTEF